MNSIFYKNTAKLMSGNIIGQLIGVISIPIIARLFGVEAYGIFSSVLAFSLILSGVSTLGLHSAVLMPKSDSEAKKIVSLAMMVIATLGSAMVVIFYIFSNIISNKLNLGTMPWIIFSIPILVISQSVYLILSHYSVRKKEFWLVSITGMSVGLIDRISAISAALLGYVSPLTLIASKVISNILSSLGLIFYKSKTKSEASAAPLNNRDIVKRYKKFIIFNTPSILLMSLTAQLPILLLTAMVSPVAAGLYAMANRVVFIPVIAIGGSLSKTYTQKISESYSSGDTTLIEIESKALLFNVFSYGLVLFTLLSVMGSFIFTLFLGPEWKEAGSLLTGLSFVAFTTLLVQTFGGIFDVYKQQEKRLIFHILNFIMKVGVLLTCLINELSLQTSIYVFSTASVMMSFLVLQVLFSILNMTLYLLKITIYNSFILLIYLYITYFFNESMDNIYFIAFGAIFISALWAGAIYHFKRHSYNKKIL